MAVPAHDDPSCFGVLLRRNIVVSENPAGYVVVLRGGAFLELAAAAERKVL